MKIDNNIPFYIYIFSTYIYNVNFCIMESELTGALNIFKFVNITKSERYRDLEQRLNNKNKLIEIKFYL